MGRQPIGTGARGSRAGWGILACLAWSLLAVIALPAAPAAGRGLGNGPPDSAGSVASRPPAVADTSGVVDPFFRWCLRVVAGDSLGTWDGRVLRRRLRRWPGRTRLPLRWLERIERTAVAPGVARATPVRRRWRLVLRRDLRVPMPYELFGYHPGRLDVSRELVFTEWDLDDAVLRWTDRDGEAGEAHADLVRGLRLEHGHLVLDLDGWLDRLLGSKLDDTWTEGMVLAHLTRCRPAADAGWTAVALGRTPRGKPMLGGFDFYRDRALDRGRPVHQALSRYARPWIAPYRLRPDSPFLRWERADVPPPADAAPATGGKDAAGNGRGGGD